MINLIQSYIPGGLIEALGMTLIHSLWQIAIIGLVLYFVLALMKKSSAQARYRVTLIALLAILVLPALTFIKALPDEAQTHYVPPQDGTIFLLSEPDVEEVAMADSPTLFAEPEGVISAFVKEYQYLLFTFWFCGMLFFTLRFTGNFYWSQRLKSYQVSLPAEYIENLMEELVDKMGIRRTVKVLHSTVVDVPLTTGWLKPVILLPASVISGLSPDQLECILIHELVHIKKQDYLINLLQSTAEIALFYHPGVWIINNQIRKERENRCDELVLDFTGRKREYAEALVKLEEIRQENPKLVLAANGGSLFERIKRIMSHGTAPTQSYRGPVSIAILLISMVGFATLMAQVYPKNQDEFASVEIPDIPETPELPSAISTLQKPFPKAPTPPRIPGMMVSMGLSNLPYTMVVDSPFTKVSLIENEEEIVAKIDGQGRIVSVEVDGVPATGEADYKYRAIVRERFRTMIDLEAPSEKEIAAMDELARAKDLENASIEASWEKLRTRLDSLSVQIEAEPSEEKRDALLQEQDALLEAHENEIERHANRLERDLQDWSNSFDGYWEDHGQEWEEFGRKMGEWGERFGKEMARRLDREFENEEQFEANMDEFEEEMERMNEGLEENLEEMMEGLEEQLENLGEQLEHRFDRSEDRNERDFDRSRDNRERANERAEEARERAAVARERAQDRAEEARDRAADARERAADARERALERAEDARERAEEARELALERAEEARERAVEARDRAKEKVEAERERAEEAREQTDSQRNKNATVDFAKNVRKSMERDGLISKGKNLNLHIKRKNIKVNGKRLTGSDKAKYIQMVEDHFGEGVWESGEFSFDIRD